MSGGWCADNLAVSGAMVMLTLDLCMVMVSCSWHFPAQFVHDCRFSILKVQLEDSLKLTNMSNKRHGDNGRKQ